MFFMCNFKRVCVCVCVNFMIGNSIFGRVVHLKNCSTNRYDAFRSPCGGGDGRSRVTGKSDDIVRRT